MKSSNTQTLFFIADLYRTAGGLHFSVITFRAFWVLQVLILGEEMKLPAAASWVSGFRPLGHSMQTCCLLNKILTTTSSGISQPCPHIRITWGSISAHSDWNSGGGGQAHLGSKFLSSVKCATQVKDRCGKGMAWENAAQCPHFQSDKTEAVK